MAEIVVVQECAVGNGEVGTMWCETAIFTENTTLADVLAWKARLPGACVGRLMITKPAYMKVPAPRRGER